MASERRAHSNLVSAVTCRSAFRVFPIWIRIPHPKFTSSARTHRWPKIICASTTIRRYDYLRVRSKAFITFPVNGSTTEIRTLRMLFRLLEGSQAIILVVGNIIFMAALNIALSSIKLGPGFAALSCRSRYGRIQNTRYRTCARHCAHTQHTRLKIKL